MAKQEKPKPGCFSGFLRVLLCAGNGTSPPVYPSDHADETEQVHPKKDKLVDDAITPGVVARLMGLDSLPNTKWVVKGTTPDSVPRSRSVNFVDYLLEFDLGHANHRRVKTSSSFREVPTLVQRQNRDLVVLDDDNDVCKVQEDGANLRKVEMGLGELKQRKKRQGSKSKEIVRERVSVKKEEKNQQGKNKKISKLKNEPRRVPYSNNRSRVRNHSEAKELSNVSPSSKSCSYRYSGVGSSSSSSSSLPNRHKKGFVEPKVKNNIRNQQSPKKMETESSLENLSPVSVLDINDYPLLNGTDFLDGTSTLASKSKCKSSVSRYLDDGVEGRAGSNKGDAYTDINREAEYYSELMLKLCTLTEKDIRESDCTSKHISETESFEEICLVFEDKIFDLLLYEVVNEVVELSS